MNIEPVDPPASAIRRCVEAALVEDLGEVGDLSAALVPRHARATFAIVSRSSGVLAGTACATECCAQVDPKLAVTWSLHDGGPLTSSTEVGRISGPLRSVLTAERSALNFLCRLSGIASLTRRYVDALGSYGHRTRILDTRKTTPGLRALEKAAVRAGGGHNHRFGLFDGVLVKDNHLAGIAIAEAVAQARARWPGRQVEIECDRIEQVEEACRAGASVVLLDNMSVAQVSECVELVGGLRPDGSTLVEVSGGVTLESAPRYAAAGADLISVGALTHSAPALDLGLDLLGSE
ncbi:MAG: carboxylating nicotinate-nucleotide diphosphorylase [Acidimicrobiales bacterium]